MVFFQHILSNESCWEALHRADAHKHQADLGTLCDAACWHAFRQESSDPDIPDVSLLV